MALPPEDSKEEDVPHGSVDPIIKDEVQAQLKQLADNPDTSQTVSIPVGDDKQERQKLHQAIKAAFPTFETRTEEKEGQKVITAMHKSSAGRDGRKSGPGQWPASKSKEPFCRFVMYKENKDTMDVISLIAKFLKVKPGLFQYAGTKDRRAKTSQEVTAHKIHPKKLRDLNSFLRNISLGNFRYVDKPLKLGQLAGNRFTIVLRNVLGAEQDLEKGLNSLKTTGFINYFGLQRFGTTTVPTHFIGRALLKENWEEAVDLILRPRPKTSALCEKFRRVWAETKDAQKTLDETESRHSIERTVLRSLCKNPKNFNGAIQSLPRNTRMMYVHSYQSFIWNKVASTRIRTYGMKPVIGDLVLPPSAENIEEDETESPKVQPVVLDETSLSQYTVYDILLPLPGHDIVYPSNDVHAWYKSLLEEDGFDINNMQRKQKDFSLPGAYRTVVVHPRDMEWQTFQYDDYTIPLALSDLERLNKEPEPVSLPDGKLRAVSVTFTLPSSSYATMALREVLKADTSPAHQTSLNTA
nr:hypothetical protein BaRGS_014962 [Batillaria attramentaria]